jgi:cytochrome P450
MLIIGMLKPDRWHDKHAASRHDEGLSSGGSKAPKSTKQPKAFIPFSDGMKNCLGQVRAQKRTHCACKRYLKGMH